MSQRIRFRMVLALGVLSAVGGVFASPRPAIASHSSPAAAHAGAVQPGVGIAGAWRLNRELSDRQAVPGSRDRAHPAGPPPGGTRDGMGGRGEGRGGFGGGGSAARGDVAFENGMLQELLTPPDSLTIAVNPGEVVITDADGHVRHYATNGKKEKHQMMTGVVDTKTRWRGALLEMELVPPGPAKVVESFTVDERTRQLVVAVKVEGGFGGARPASRRVYDNLLDLR
jgi:hypothetical protein